MINSVSVPLAAHSGPSFRNTLSAGDRNTLALAFFFASLTQDPELAQKVVVLDDPMTSLDEHRSMATVQALRRFQGRVSQIIALSHSKPFLFGLWRDTEASERSALTIHRVTDGSNLAAWDIESDSAGPHSRRYELVEEYLRASDAAKEREVAQSLRPILEAFLRGAFPHAFRGLITLGQFQDQSSRRLGTERELLNEADTSRLGTLIEYSNQFHHETNSAFAAAVINDQELTRYCRMVLAFTRRH